jgi:ABC-type transport system involved in multi-copper enzyme maturation permease subunit
MSALSVGGTLRAGLANQTRREASMWWGTSRWWRQGLVWTVLLGGLLAGVLWVLPAIMAGAEGSDVAAMDLAQGAAQFTELAAFVTAVGVVILTQGVLLDEQRSGLHEWLLSKPLSRPALVLAKLAGHGSGLLFSLVLAPWLGIYLLLSLAAGQPWPVGRFLGAVGLVGLFALFHLALVLALSAVFVSRGAVLGIPLALLVGADLLVTAVPWAADGMPYLVNRVAAALVATGVLAAPGPALATAVATAALAAVAVWRFNRQEL